MTKRKTFTPHFLRAAAALLVGVMTFATARAEVLDGNMAWYYYETDGGKCTISRHSGTDEDHAGVTALSIPKTLDGKTVIGISTEALNGYINLETLRFYQNGAIENMPYIKSGSKFTTVLLLDDNGTTIAGTTNCLPASMKEIGIAFMGTGITTLTMPNVTSIGDRAFEGCNSLTSVTFGQAVNIWEYSKPFQKISSSCTVTYPGPMAKWSPYNYQYSPNLVVNCTDGSCGWCGDGWGDGWTEANNLYKGNSCLYWTLGTDGHLTIDCLQQDIILYNNDNYSKQTIKTTNWDSGKVTSLTLGHVYEISEGVFLFYPGLTSVTISEGVTSIGIFAFEGCSGLTSITLPESVTSIGYDAFYLCTGLPVVDNIRYADTYAFEAVDRSLTTYVIREGTKWLGNNIFSGCNQLTSVALPSGLTEIGIYAFYGCTGLSSIILPSSLTLVGTSAFCECTNLNDLYYAGTRAQWDAVKKQDCWNQNMPSGYTVHFPCTVTFVDGRDNTTLAQISHWTDSKLQEPAIAVDGSVVAGWTYRDANNNLVAWDIDNDVVQGDMTFYAVLQSPCAATFATQPSTVEIPYGQEWTDIPVTASSLTLEWFRNGVQPARQAAAVAVTPRIADGASAAFNLFPTGDGEQITAYKGAGAHTDGNRLSEPMTAVGQSGKLWVHIPASEWAKAASGTYVASLDYDAVFISNSPEETYAYSLGSAARVTLSVTVPEAVTVTFDANGGTGDAMAAVVTRAGTAITLPACTFAAPAGKTFLCWNTKADGKGARYMAGSTFTPRDSQTAFYAQWGEGYSLDLTATAVGETAGIPLSLSGQLTQLTGYFKYNDDNTENAPVGFLDLNLDGTNDLALVYGRDANDNMTASVKKLTSLTANYRFVLTPTDEEEYGSVLIQFVAGGQAVEPPVIESLYDDNGTYNREQLVSLKADGRTHSLMLSGRTLYADGDWNTLCLPFDIDNFSGTPLDGLTVMELDTETAYDGHVTGVDGSTLYLNFKAATAIEAGKPYIVKWPAPGTDLVNPVFYDVTVTAATREVPNPFRNSYEDPEFITAAVPADVAFTGGKFCGTYDPTEIYDDEHTKYFLGAANTLYWPDSKNYTVKAFRAYFDLSDGASNVRAMRLSFGEGTTAVELPSMGDGEWTEGDGEWTEDNDADAWYDLAGRRLADRPAAPGIYIRNGRKVVKRF